MNTVVFVMTLADVLALWVALGLVNHFLVGFHQAESGHSLTFLGGKKG